MEQKSELESILTNLFYDYMSSTNIEEFDGEKVEDSSLTPVDLLYQETVNTLKDDVRRIKMLEKGIEEAENEEEVETIKENLQPLLEEKVHIENSSMEYMKKLYEKTRDVTYSRNVITIPLRSSRYNVLKHWIDEKPSNFKIEVQYLFYDDLGVLKGKYDQYKALKPTQLERRDFIEANTEITHICLIVNGVSYISVKGEVQKPEKWMNIEAFKITPVEV